MVPALLPGDHVVTFRGLGPWRPRLRVGDLVAVVDPRQPGRMMVKRVAGLEAGQVVVRGDNEAASTDSRHFGPISPGGIQGRVVYRYHPEDRRGWLRRRS